MFDLTGFICQEKKLNYRVIYGVSVEKITIAIFYWVTEIPIFLMLNLIWIISEKYISESMGQRLNPKIIDGGHVGIVIGGCIAVFSPSFFKISMQSLTYVWGGILFVAMLMTLIVYKVCLPLPKERTIRRKRRQSYFGITIRFYQ